MGAENFSGGEEGQDFVAAKGELWKRQNTYVEQRGMNELQQEAEVAYDEAWRLLGSDDPQKKARLDEVLQQISEHRLGNYVPAENKWRYRSGMSAVAIQRVSNARDDWRQAHSEEVGR